MRKINISMHINFSGDSTEFQYPVYRSTDGYALYPCKNLFGSGVSYWISKKDCTVSRYAFTVHSLRDLRYMGLPSKEADFGLEPYKNADAVFNSFAILADGSCRFDASDILEAVGV